MTASPPLSATQRQLAAIDRMHRRFTANDIQYWHFGGWAVDFHVGRITRPHADIDLAVWLSDIERIAALLETDQWRRTPESGDDMVTYQHDGVRAEIAFLARDDSGIIYTPVEGGRGDWPQHAFGDEIAELARVHARVIGLAALMQEKAAGYGDAPAQAKDRIDIAVLAASAVPHSREQSSD
jgi:hypothetical protein